MSNKRNDKAGKETGKGTVTDEKAKIDAPKTETMVDKGKKDAKDVKANPVSLEDAKARFDAAKKANQDTKTQMRKDKKLVDKAADRKAKYNEQIRKAQANTTKSAEELLKKAEEFEKETLKLKKDGKDVIKKAKGVRDELETLRLKLGEVRTANKLERKAKQGDNPRKANPAAAKVALVKALKKRKWVERVNEDGAAIGATDDKGTNLVFEPENFTLTIGKDKPVLMEYGAGAIQRVEKAVEEAEAKVKAEAEEAKAKKEAEAEALKVKKEAEKAEADKKKAATG